MPAPQKRKQRQSFVVKEINVSACWTRPCAEAGTHTHTHTHTHGVARGSQGQLRVFDLNSGNEIVQLTKHILDTVRASDPVVADR
jgi:hypothetical protein